MNAPGPPPVSRALRWLSVAAWISFWLYIGTVVVAGFWGLFGARLDFPLLLNQQVGRLSHGGAADVLSQYRFLRGIEAGFGLFAVRFRREIFTTSVYNQLFLVTMFMGILGRVLGWVLDGQPTADMFVFLGGEAVGIVCIFAATRPAVLHALSPPAASASGAATVSEH